MRRSFLLCHILVYGLWLTITLIHSQRRNGVLAGSSECPFYSVLGFSALCYQVKKNREAKLGVSVDLEFFSLLGDP